MNHLNDQKCDAFVRCASACLTAEYISAITCSNMFAHSAAADDANAVLAVDAADCGWMLFILASASGLL